MNDPKFTKGEWRLGNTPQHDNANMIFAGNTAICQVYGLPLHASLQEFETSPRFAEQLANAFLLRAAPDMYAALEYIYNAVQFMGLPVEAEWTKSASSALAEARGEA